MPGPRPTSARFGGGGAGCAGLATTSLPISPPEPLGATLGSSAGPVEGGNDSALAEREDDGSIGPAELAAVLVGGTLFLQVLGRYGLPDF